MSGVMNFGYLTARLGEHCAFTSGSSELVHMPDAVSTSRGSTIGDVGVSDRRTRDVDSVSVAAAGPVVVAIGPVSTDIGGVEVSRMDVGGVDVCGGDIGGIDVCGGDVDGIDVCGVDVGGIDICGVDVGEVKAGVDVGGAGFGTVGAIDSAMGEPGSITNRRSRSGDGGFLVEGVAVLMVGGALGSKLVTRPGFPIPRVSNSSIPAGCEKEHKKIYAIHTICRLEPFAKLVLQLVV